MKKLCSLALVLCMLLTLVVIPTAAEPAAAEHIPFGESDTTYTDGNGVVYTILRTKADFLAIENGKNYILAGDINLDMTASGANTSAFGAEVTAWYEGILDGNGYAIYGYSVTGGNNAGLFWFAGNATTGKVAKITIKNLSFGTEESPFSFAMTGNGSCGVVAGKVLGGSEIVMINCHAFIKHTGAKALQGGFFGQTQGAVSFRFENCTTNGSLVGANKTGGFISAIDKTGCSATFINCANNANITGTTQGVGGFVGQNTQTDTVFYFENCVNNGNITTGTDGGTAGFLGYTKASPVSFVNCENKGTINATASFGDFVGTFGDTAQTLNVITPVDKIPATPAGNPAKTTVNLSLTAAADGTASAGWQKTEADANGKVKVRLVIAISDQYLNDVTDMTVEGTFGLTAGGSKTLTVGKEKIKFYSSVEAAGETLAAAEGYVLLAVVVENIPEADWNGNVGIKLTATGANGAIEAYQYDSAAA